jgi:hypothetical protein
MPMVGGNCSVLTLIEGRSEGGKWNKSHSITHTILTAGALAIVLGLGVLTRPGGELVVVLVGGCL